MSAKTVANAMDWATVDSDGFENISNDLAVHVTVSASYLVVELGENVHCDRGAFGPVDHDNVGVFL